MTKKEKQGFTMETDEESKEAFKKVSETNIENILKSLTEVLSQPLPKRNEIDYMCSQCQGCLFFEEENLGMDGSVYLCKANEPRNDYFDGHEMRWVSACDCSIDEEVKKFYLRKCPNYCSYAKLMEQKLKELKENK